MRHASPLVVSLLLVAPLAAQDFGPAPQLAKLDRLVGTWEGTGKVYMGASAPSVVTTSSDAAAVKGTGRQSSTWTARSTYKKVLGGHFVQCDEVVEFPEGSGMPGSLVFRSLTGWDREAKAYKTWTISNMGKVEVGQVHWLDDETMVTCVSGTEQGQPKLERWTTKLGKEAVTFAGYQAIGDGEFDLHVEGSMKRIKDTPRATDASAVKAFMPPSPELAKLANMLGTYQVKGEMVMAPGQAPTPISGTETLSLTMGGTIIEGVIHGDPIPGMPGGPYESWGAWGWDAERGCYVSICADNMGMVCAQDVRWAGKDLVATMAGTEMGNPIAVRSILKCGSDGSLASVTCHSLSATHDPYVAFKASYTKK